MTIKIPSFIKSPSIYALVAAAVSTFFGTVNPTNSLGTNGQDGLLAIAVVILGLLTHHHVGGSVLVAAQKKLTQIAAEQEKAKTTTFS